MLARESKTGGRPLRPSSDENRLWAGAAPPQNPAMPTTNRALLPLTAAATPVRFQQQTGRPEGPTPPTS